MKILVLTSKYGLPFQRKDRDEVVELDGERHEVHFRHRHYGNVKDHRKNALTPRARCKVDKCFAWQLYPDYDAYVHSDSTVTWNSAEAVVDFVQLMDGEGWVGFKHPQRQRVDLEAIYTDGCVRANNPYHKNRYQGEDLIGQANSYLRMAERIGEQMPPMTENTIFAYSKGFIRHNGTDVLTLWFAEMMRWSVQDQISLPYVMMLWGVKPVYAEGTCKKNKWTTWSAKDHFK